MIRKISQVKGTVAQGFTSVVKNEIINPSMPILRLSLRACLRTSKTVQS